MAQPTATIAPSQAGEASPLGEQAAAQASPALPPTPQGKYRRKPPSPAEQARRLAQAEKIAEIGRQWKREHEQTRG